MSAPLSVDAIAQRGLPVAAWPSAWGGVVSEGLASVRALVAAALGTLDLVASVDDGERLAEVVPLRGRTRPSSGPATNTPPSSASAPSTPPPSGSEGSADAALVEAARRGERWAQEGLFRRYGRYVNGLAYRLLPNDAELDDLVQDSFVEALASLERLSEPSAFASWIGAIVVRTAHKRIRRRRLMERIGLRRREPVDLDAITHDVSSPEAALELRRVYAVLDAMDAEERIALVLRRVEGLELTEVAERMGLSLATVKRRLAAAEKKLPSRGDEDEVKS